MTVKNCPRLRSRGLGQDWQIDVNCQLVDCSQWGNIGNAACWNFLGIPGLFGVGTCNQPNAAAVQQASGVNPTPTSNFLPIAIIAGAIFMTMMMSR